MDVYLVPVAADRHELYCEIPDDAHDGPSDPPSGYVKRLVHRFREMIAEAERERREGTASSPPNGWLARVRARTMRWVAETIAEQKLLWHLRKETAAVLHYPDDLDETTAAALMREYLGRDYKKHRLWLAIDSVLMILFGVVLFAVPGPNIVGYYFAFRVVGHFLSVRGARQGLAVVTWRHEASAPLTELRRVLSLDPTQREDRVHAVARMLRLEHLASFFQRAAVSV